MNKIEVMDSVMDIVPKHKIGINDVAHLHFHNCYEIFLSLTSDAKFFVGDDIYEVNKYDLFLFNTSDIHRISVKENSDYERYVIMFPPVFFEKGFKDIEKFRKLFVFSAKRKVKISLKKEVAENITALIDKMIECESDANKNLKRELYLSQVLILIDESLKSNCENADKKISKRHGNIEAIIEYIRDNFDKQITLESLSRQFYFNKYYLCRLFKEQTGFNVGQYVESIRISNAMSLLGQGFSVSEVANKVGFGSDTYFISTFKKNMGVSPKKYIKDLQSNV